MKERQQENSSEKTIKILKKYLAELQDTDDLDKLDKILLEMQNFRKKITAKYPDADDYRLFHVLFGSTPFKDHKLTKFDFSGEDSVKKFIFELKKKYSS